MTGSEKSQARCFVSGRVQGVAFRAYTQDVASRLGLTGFVRNLPDGRVQVVAEGSRDLVGQLIDWCKNGPALARVDEIEVDWGPPSEEYKSFEVKFY
jgi:acylphosphatase